MKTNNYIYIFLLMAVSAAGGFFAGTLTSKIRPAEYPPKKKSAAAPETANSQPQRLPAEPPKNFNRVIEDATWVSLGTRLQSYCDYLIALAKKDGRQAVALAASNLKPAEIEEVLPSVLAAWAASAPGDALAWYRDAAAKDAIPGGMSFDGSNALITAAMATLTKAQPAQALKEAIDFETEAERRIALSSLARNAVMHGNAAAVVPMLQQLPDDLRLTTESEIFARWIAFDEERAMRSFAEIDPASREELISSVGGGMMHSNPARGAEWWLQQVPDEQRTATLNQIITTWAARTPNIAGQWIIDHLPVGAERDAASESLAQTAFERDPEAALGWVASIGNVNLRQETWVRLWQTIERTNPRDAQRILDAPTTRPELRTAAEMARQAEISN